MSAKYFNNTLSVDETCFKESYAEEIAEVNAILGTLESYMDEVQINRYLEELWKLFSLGNGIIAKKEPWSLMKANQGDAVAELLVFIANVLLRAALYLSPCMPSAANAITSVFGLEVNAQNFATFIVQNKFLTTITLNPIPALFPRIDEKRIEEAGVAVKAESQHKEQWQPLEIPNAISKEDFSKMDIRIGTILSAEILPKSEKLLKLQVDLGEVRARQILAGIKTYYNPQELVGMQVCVLANLKPAKLMGEISEGMILAAKDGTGLALIAPQKQKINGSQIS